MKKARRSAASWKIYGMYVEMLWCMRAASWRQKNSTLEKERVGAGIGPTALGR